MKIRVYKRLIDGVFHVLVNTEDWSENDRRLMLKYGEPEINLGGRFVCVPNSGEESTSSDSHDEIAAVIDDVYVRIMTESPYKEKFDSRDYGSVHNAKLLSQEWISEIEDRIINAVAALRSNDDSFSTEEIMEY